MSYIYKITNDINNKVYIGKTSRSIDKRWKEHLRDRKREKYKRRRLYSEMNTYGVDHFHIEQIEETDNPEEREIYWIKYYNSTENGYNITKGGKGKFYIDRGVVLETYNKLKTCKDVASEICINKQTVSKILKENNIEITTGQEYSKRNCSKRVLMSLKENIPLMYFSSLSDAARYLQENNISKDNNVSGIVHHIGEVCNSKRKSAYGYKWSWA